MELWITDATQLDRARTIVDSVLWPVAAASNRFDATSELSLLTAVAATEDVHTKVSPMLEALLKASMEASTDTCGLVDPTVGKSLTFWGYDRDIVSLEERTSVVRLAEGPGEQEASEPQAHFRLEEGMLSLDRGTFLDLGATAKAQAADLAAEKIYQQLGCGVLVNLGGDNAVAGPSPEGGWRISVDDGADQPEETIAVHCGEGEHVGIATSSTLHRKWNVQVAGAHGAKPQEIVAYHIIDPRTGAPDLRTATVVADSAVHANAWSTALIVLGAQARGVESLINLPVRTVDRHGQVSRSGWWPAPIYDEGLDATLVEQYSARKAA